MNEDLEINPSTLNDQMEHQMDLFSMPVGHRAEMYVIAAFLTAMAYWKHRENIKRLLSGTERKTYLFKKNKEALN